MPFAHLHSHTSYSLLDGSNKIPEYIKQVKELGMKSAAITDHGVMYGVVEFYKCAKEAGIHPVIGCEVYVAQDSMTNKNDRGYYHLILLAENNEGYQNLIKLVSLGHTDGFYYRPRIDFKALSDHHKGLIALSGCLAGEVPKKLLQGNYKGACETALRYQSLFGSDNYFLELQDHGIADQKTVNEKLIRMHKELGIPLVATNDVHYTKQEDAEAHDVLLCIQTKRLLTDKDRLRYEGNQYYVKSPEEMYQLFPEIPEALENTEKIASRCQVEFTFNRYHLPKFEPPKGYDSWGYLNKLCMDGLMERYPDCYKDHEDSLSYELNTIKKMGFVDYFLITWDFINYAKENGIPVGPGRGSAAGSLVAYCLKITEVDPKKYNLLFERFLNPERVTMPDIDIDFCYERRHEVIDYVVSKYGKDQVAQIVTFGTLAAKGVIRDVGRVLGIPASTVSQISQLIPSDTKTTLDSALADVPELKKKYDDNDTIRKLIDISKCLEGLPRHTSTHAAGVVICPKEVSSFVPVCISSEGALTTQFVMTTLEELGLLKMDFLGLRTLTVIQKARDAIKQNYNTEVTFDYQDPAVFRYISTGKTDGIFQLESNGMKSFMRQLKPQNLEDLIAGISLYRPGPMDFIPKYISGKADPTGITYEIPQLKEILDPTYGCIIYQEQVMQIVRTLAGYNYGRADLVRRAMSKKKSKVMEDERKVFLFGNENVNGCVSNGIAEDAANRIYDQMIDFAKYAFNKSHATTYAVVAYQTAYLKYYYPAEFLAALMSSVRSDAGKTAEYLLLSRQLSIPITKPDVNCGNLDFTVKQNAIIYSLASIRDVGANCVVNLCSERSKKPFQDMKDFLSRMSNYSTFNKRTVEALIKAGAMDCFGHTRKHMLEQYPEILNRISYEKKNGMAGQTPLFNLFTVQKKAPEEEFPLSVLLAYEKEVLGIYLSGHPLDEFYLQWISGITAKSTDFQQSKEVCTLEDGKIVTIGGIISSVVEKQTRHKKKMAIVTLEDLVGSIDVIVFPQEYEDCREKLKEGEKVFFTGTVKEEDDKNATLIFKKIMPINESISEVWLQFPNIQIYEKLNHTLEQIYANYDGNAEIKIYLKNTRQVKRLDTNRLLVNEESWNSLCGLLGQENVRLR
ncbi:MAG: DNA polymerase III subunit alpha [Lachnospiraceae bacterium]|nr:DNA polymerase III subunit alpha [Lachnospiraceae bacterium]